MLHGIGVGRHGRLESELIWAKTFGLRVVKPLLTKLIGSVHWYITVSQSPQSAKPSLICG